MFEDVLLDALSVVSQSRNHDFAQDNGRAEHHRGRAARADRRPADPPTPPGTIAATRREGRQGIALLLAVSTWAGLSSDAALSGRMATTARRRQSDERGRADEGRRAAPSEPGPVSAYVPPRGDGRR